MKRAVRVSAPTGISSVAYMGRCFFYGLVLRLDGTNNVTLNIYDGVRRLIPTDTVIPGTARFFLYSVPLPICCVDDINVNVAVAGGGTCSYQVFYNTENR